MTAQAQAVSARLTLPPESSQLDDAPTGQLEHDAQGREAECDGCEWQQNIDSGRRSSFFVRPGGAAASSANVQVPTGAGMNGTPIPNGSLNICPISWVCYSRSIVPMAVAILSNDSSARLLASM
jgi:hypothetical protein